MNLLLKQAAAGQASLAPALVEADTLVASDLSAPEWSYIDEATGNLTATVRLATAAEGGNEVDEYIINPALANGSDWYVGQLIACPPGSTGLTISCEIKRVAGDSSGNAFAFAVLNQAASAWYGTPNHQTVTPTASWAAQSFTVTAALSNVALYPVLIAHSAFGRVGATRVLVRKLKVTPVGASGVFAGAYYRVGASGNLRGDTRAGELATADMRQRQDAQARFELKTTATKWAVDLRASIYPQYTTQAKALVSADYVMQSQPAVTAKSTPAITTGTLSAGKKSLRVFVPLAAYNPTRTELQHGEVRAVFLDDPAPKLLRRPSRRLYLLGDSITAGWSATIPQQDSWASILRDSYRVDVCVDGVGSRQLKDLELQGATPGYPQTGWGHHAARAAAWGATDVVVALGVNDWGLAGASVTYTAAQYGAALVALAAAVHAAIPSAHVWVVTPLVTNQEAATNTNTETLDSFRDAADSALASVAYATCINGLDLVEASGISGDGVHPINAGHEQFADNFALAAGL